MAKQAKVLPARRQGDRAREDASVLMRSAESLGRMIGSLQRQLDGAARRLAQTANVTPAAARTRKTTRKSTSRKRAASKTSKKR